MDRTIDRFYLHLLSSKDLIRSNCKEKNLEILTEKKPTIKEFFGKGIGGHLLTDAILNSFKEKINKVWVHTCTLDHPNALKNYLARGMTIFRTEKIFFNPENL